MRVSADADEENSYLTIKTVKNDNKQKIKTNIEEAGILKKITMAHLWLAKQFCSIQADRY